MNGRGKEGIDFSSPPNSNSSLTKSKTEILNCQEVVSGPFLMETRCLGPVAINRLSHHWNTYLIALGR